MSCTKECKHATFRCPFFIFIYLLIETLSTKFFFSYKFMRQCPFKEILMNKKIVSCVEEKNVCDTRKNHYWLNMICLLMFLLSSHKTFSSSGYKNQLLLDLRLLLSRLQIYLTLCKLMHVLKLLVNQCFKKVSTGVR